MRLKVDLLKAKRLHAITQTAQVTTSSLAHSFNGLDRKKHDFWRKSVGLFQIPTLASPYGFLKEKDQVISKGWKLLEDVVSCEPGKETIILFDELSDTLCRIADLSDFVKCSHPDSGFAEAAAEAHLSIGTMVEELNTNTDLYQALSKVTDDPDIRKTLDEETCNVADLFLYDFKISGIHLEAEKRQQAVMLHEEILMATAHFLQISNTPVLVDKDVIPENIRHYFARDGDNVVIGGLHCENSYEGVREAAYKMYYYNNPDAEAVLSCLFEKRFQLAKLLGYDSYANRALQSTMAQNDQNVVAFLFALSKGITPYAQEEFNILEGLKADDYRLNRSFSNQLKSWDVPYYSARLRDEESSTDASLYSAYFSLGDCMEGLNHLFQALYGVSLVNEPMEKGESWSDDIIKLAVVEKNNVLGYIYCDFFQRAGKPQQDCHFTIRGSRQLRDGSFQLPIVVLMLHLRSPTAHKPTLLSPAIMHNLFHEMGHAMHSMLAQTRYQHVSGTRCATDFAEVPSILMEYFAKDPTVLSSFARHYRTGEKLPPDMVNSLCRADKLLAFSEMQMQVFYSITDQYFHGEFDSSAPLINTLKQIQSEHYCLPPEGGICWHQRFSHFGSYGAKYYSYLMSRAVASRLWRKCFKSDPFNRDMGNRYRNEMLRHGGGKHPITMYENMLEEKFDLETLVQSLITDHKLH